MDPQIRRAHVWFSVFIISILLRCSIQSAGQPAISKPSDGNALDSLVTPIIKIEALFANRDSGVSVCVKGNITGLLSDDTVGDKHQRFIIQMSNAQTLLIAHNVDVGARVLGVSTGALIYVHGDYIWNSQGGLIHWTHKDPAGKHENGWIVFNGKKFE